MPWGMGLGGNRSLKKEIMDPETFKTLVRDWKIQVPFKVALGCASVDVADYEIPRTA
jgi:hypothetical protein